MRVSCCVRSTITNWRLPTGSKHGARVGQVRVPYSKYWKATCSVGLLRSTKIINVPGHVRAHACTAGYKTNLSLEPTPHIFVMHNLYIGLPCI